MIRSKKDITRVLNKVAEAKIQQGLYLKELVFSIERHYKNKTYKELKEFIKPLLEKINVKIDII